MIYNKFQKNRKKLFWTAFVWLLFFSVNLLYNSVPDELYVVQGEETDIHFSAPVSLERKEESVAAFYNNASLYQGKSDTEDYELACKFLNLIPIKDVAVHVVEKRYVMPCGFPIGIYAKTDGVLIIGTGKVAAKDGLNYEPADSLVQKGDYIVAVNGIAISKKEELIRLMNECRGEAVILGIMRNNKPLELQIDPVALEDGSYKLGIWVRDDMAGVGTLTYMEEDRDFGALGHPVSDADTGNAIELLEGKVYNTDIVGIVKGENGAPGELTGVINYNEQYCLGTILENTNTGIYGNLSQIPDNMEEAYVEIGMKQDISKNKAYVLSSLDGVIKQYEIEIDDVDFNDREKNKGIIFHVTDKSLLEKTGGVVQGMSGSPIIQDGKLIGAVTHVLVNDPTRGYGMNVL